MKIAVLTSLWPSTENPISGIFVAEHVEALVEAGHQVHVVVTSPRPGHLCSLSDLQLRGRVSLRKVRTFFVPSSVVPQFPGVQTVRLVANTAIAALLATPRLRHHTRGADAIMIHNQVPVGFYAPRWHRGSTPVAVIVHGAAPEYARSDVARKLRFLLPKTSAFAYRAATLRTDATRDDVVDRGNEPVVRVFPVGQTLVPYLSALGVPAAAVINNGTRPVADSDVAVSDHPSWERLRACDDNTVRLLCVANLHEEKRVDDLLRALAGLKAQPWELDIIGDGPEHGTLRRLADHLKIAHRVRFHGRTGRADVLQAMTQADIFALPSSRESFGLVFLEAAMRAVPAIGCRHTGAEEVIEDRITGMLVEPRDVLQLQGALRQLIADPALREQMGTKARDCAKNRTWDRYNTQLFQALGL